MVEVLMATVIFSIGFVALANLMLSSLKDSADSRNLIIASELAQEGVELVRNFRDNNIALATGNAFNNMNTAPNGMNCPKIGGMISSPNLATCLPIMAGFSAGQLFYDSANYSYVYNNNSGAYPATPFLRKVTISADANAHVVRSMVIWGSETFPAVGSCNPSSRCTYVDLILNDSGLF